MSKNNNSSFLTTLLEVGPVFIFFLVYMLRRNTTIIIAGYELKDLIQATAILVPLMVLSTGLAWWLNGHLTKIQVLTLVLVIIFGTLTIIFQDPNFIKMKPTIIYLLFGGAISHGLISGSNHLQNLLGDRLPMEDKGWLIISRRLAAFFFILAALNEIIRQTQTQDTWVFFKTFGFSGAMIVFMLLQYPIIKKYGHLDDL